MKHKHHLFVQHIIQLRTFCDTCSVVVYINSFGIFSFLFFYPKHILDLAFLSKLKPYDLVLLARKSTILVTTSTSAVVFQRSFFVNFADCDIYSEKTSFVAVLFELPIQEKKRKMKILLPTSLFSLHPPPSSHFFSRIRNFLFRFPLCRYVVLEMFCLILN